jgi:hypothetical protein
VVEQVMSLKFLGMEISNGALKSEVKHQASKSATLSGYLNDIIWRNTYLKTELNVII